MPEPKTKLKSKRKVNWAPYALLAPGLILVVLMMGYPLLYSLRLSVFNYKMMEPDNIYFNGLDNYIKLFTNPDLLLVLKNSIIWVVSVVSLQFLLGFLLAMILDSCVFRGKGAYQSVIFLPWAISGFLIGLIFKWLFSQHNGFVNYALMKIGLIAQPVSWLGSVQLSKVVPIISMVWYGVPFFGIMILAALQSISPEVLESADIDGAKYWQKFMWVIIPYIKPTITITLLLRVIWVFNSSDTIYVTTGGGPANSSNTLPLYIFNQAYNSMDFGYGAAAGILMMIVLALYALLYLKFTKYDESEEF